MHSSVVVLSIALSYLLQRTHSQTPETSVDVERCVNRWRQLKPHLAHRFTPKQIAWFCLRTGITPPKSSAGGVSPGIAGSKPLPKSIDLDSLLLTKTKGVETLSRGENNGVDPVKVNVQHIFDMDPDLECVEELIRKKPEILRSVTREQLRWQCRLSRGQMSVMSRDAMKKLNTQGRRKSFADQLNCRGAECLKQIYKKTGTNADPLKAPPRIGDSRRSNRRRQFRRRKNRRTKKTSRPSQA